MNVNQLKRILISICCILLVFLMFYAATSKETNNYPTIETPRSEMFRDRQIPEDPIPVEPSEPQLVPSSNDNDIDMEQEQNPFQSSSDCNPELDVVFHKTHKCSSSTIQNIMLRYAKKHELNVVLPKSGNYLGKAHPFRAGLLRGTPWEEAGLHYNIFCLHNRWNGKEVEKIMGRSNHQRPVYFTILREPVELFRSHWDYLSMQKTYGMSLDEYLLSERNEELKNRVVHFGRNQMMWDFSMDPSDFDDEKAVMEKIEEIDDTFDLVMITERFPESIVLLKNLLCWDYVDVSSLKLNAHEESTKSQLSDKARDVLKKWLWADYQLYNHFVAKFDLEVKSFGLDRMESELEIMKEVNDNVKYKCGASQVSNKDLDPAKRLHGAGVLGYKLNENDDECRHYGIKEITFLNEMRAIQTKRAEAESGMKFDDSNAKAFDQLGSHMTIADLQARFKSKSPH